MEEAMKTPPQPKKHLTVKEVWRCEQVKEFVVHVRIPITVEARTHEIASRKALAAKAICQHKRLATIVSIVPK